MDREPHEETQPLARDNRAASMENGLLASAPAASEVSCERSRVSARAPPATLALCSHSALRARAQVVTSSLDDDKCCRICLEAHDKRDDPYHAEHLIAPCQCRGSSGWVHRGCLDRWRATQEDRAFSQCTECTFAYEYVAPDDDENKGWLFDDGPLTPARRRRLRFQMYVTRDFLAVFVVLQLCVFLIAGLVRKMDCGKFKNCVGIDPTDWNSTMSYYHSVTYYDSVTGEVTDEPPASVYHDDSAYCCPDVRRARAARSLTHRPSQVVHSVSCFCFTRGRMWWRRRG
jgi:hypothetical protein